jgi:hypothetical protein
MNLHIHDLSRMLCVLGKSAYSTEHQWLTFVTLTMWEAVSKRVTV